MSTEHEPLMISPTEEEIASVLELLSFHQVQKQKMIVRRLAFQRDAQTHEIQMLKERIEQLKRGLK